MLLRCRRPAKERPRTKDWNDRQTNISSLTDGKPKPGVGAAACVVVAAGAVKLNDGVEVASAAERKDGAGADVTGTLVTGVLENGSAEGVAKRFGAGVADGAAAPPPPKENDGVGAGAGAAAEVVTGVLKENNDA